MSRRTSATIRKSSDGTKNLSSSKVQSFWQRSMQAVKPWLVIGSIIGFVGLFSYIVYQKSTGGIQNFINLEPKILNETLSYTDYNHRNSLPIVLYCDRDRPYSSQKKSSKTDNIIENLPGIFTNLNLQNFPFAINYGILNCSQSSHYDSQDKKPSIFEKFKLKKEWKPVIWGKSPWNRHYYKNVQANPNYLKDITTLKKFVTNYFAPRAVTIDSHKQLLKYCQFQGKYVVYDENDIPPTCILIMKGQRYQTKLHSELEQRLVTTYPNVRFAMIDATKLRLNHEDVNIVTPEHFGIKLHALRNGTHYLDMVNPATWDYMDTFVSHAVAVPISDYMKSTTGEVSLIKPSKLKSQQEKKNKKNKSSKKSSESKKTKASSKKVTDDEDNEEEEVLNRKETRSHEKPTEDLEEDEFENQEELKEKTRLEQAERERKIRENMDRQQREHLYDTSGESEEEETSESEHEEKGDDEEVVIEL